MALPNLPLPWSTEEPRGLQDAAARCTAETEGAGAWSAGPAATRS
jgi:hypothetical protein